MASHFLSFDDLHRKEVERVVRRAVELSIALRTGGTPPSLAGKRIGLIVDDTGWRNTTALNVGARSLGASCTSVPVSLSGGEDVCDLARFLSNWFDLLAVRTPALDALGAFAACSERPVINLRTRQNHPCETLGDLSFVSTRRGTLEGLRVVAVAPAANIVNSWAEAAKVISMTLVQVAPRRYWIDPGRYDGAHIVQTEDLSAVSNADVIITDAWPKTVGDGELEGLRITEAVLEATPAGGLFLPCPPVTRGAEVSAGAMSHERCCVFAAKDFLLHAQNALLEHLLISAT